MRYAGRIPVDEYTTPSPFTVSLKTSIIDVMESMTQHRIRHVPVVDEGRPIGMISDRDVQILRRVSDAEWVTAEQVMTPHPFVVESGTALEDAVAGMAREKIGSAVVTDAEGQVVGIFTSTDALNALLELLRASVD